MENCGTSFREWCKAMNLEMRKGLTKEQQEGFLRACREKMRKERLLQVREQENKFSAQQIQAFLTKRQLKTEAVIRQLKGEWEEEHEFRVQQLEERCCFALQHIGEGHRAAAMLLFDKMNNAKRLQKCALENEALEAERYKEALQEEHNRREQIEELGRLANKRKKTKEVAACLERSIVRFATHTLGMKRKKQKFGLSSEDGKGEAGKAPTSPFKATTYKRTYFHAIPFAKPTAERGEAGTDIDAWKAADAQRQAMQNQKEVQADIKKILKRRIFLRGQAATSRILMQKRVQDLQRELERVERSERDRKRRFVLDKPPKRLTPTRADAETTQVVKVSVGSPPQSPDQAPQTLEENAPPKTLEMKLTVSDGGQKKVKIIVPREEHAEDRKRRRKPNRQLEIACERLAIASLRPGQVNALIVL